MVQSVSGNNHNDNTLQQAGQLGNSKDLPKLDGVGAVESTVTKPAANTNVVDTLFGSDQSDISSAALERYNKEKEALAFGRLLQTQPETVDATSGSRVDYFKQLLNTGRINEYLSRFEGNDTLVNDLLNSPTAAFLSK